MTVCCNKVTAIAVVGTFLLAISLCQRRFDPNPNLLKDSEAEKTDGNSSDASYPLVDCLLHCL
jgi:hypothetical protein